MTMLDMDDSVFLVNDMHEIYGHINEERDERIHEVSLSPYMSDPNPAMTNVSLLIWFGLYGYKYSTLMLLIMIRLVCMGKNVWEKSILLIWGAIIINLCMHAL